MTHVVDGTEYPHDIHPALVPGVNVEDQKIRYGIDWKIVGPVGALIVAFIIWGIASPQSVMDVSSAMLTWVMENMGWLFNSVSLFLVPFLIVIALSRFGKIKLGLDDEEPEYSTSSWAAMLFAAGIGIGIIFFGPLEPLTHYLSPLPGLYDPASQEAVKGAIAQSLFHWGLNGWAIYGVVGLCVAYVSFRKGRVPLMSSVLSGLWGGDSSSWQNRLVDGLAIIATLFGTAASLGIGAMQIARGAEIVTGWGPQGNGLAIGIISVLTAGTIASAVSGVSKGIRTLSNVNMVLALLLAIFFFVAGPTVFLMNIIPGVFTQYFAQMPEMLSATMSDGEATKNFLSGWTTFYWAWWISWTPFVGVFTAKISRGRSIRQFIAGVLCIPTTIIMLAFTILGGVAIYKQREFGELAPGNNPSSMPDQESVFFHVLEYLPGAQFVAPVVMVMLAIFFITSADSASLVNSQLSQRGNPNPRRGVTAFWALCMAGIAVVILLMGGPDALSGLQNLVTVTALPFAFVLVLMCVALIKELRKDPAVIRQYYETTAVQQAVRRGISEHGDNFAISVEPVDPSGPGGIDFDSTSAEYTEWYIRTDEDGNPLEYDYSIGAYLDPVTGEPIVDDADGLGDDQGEAPRA